jgi:hypothetical protein
MRPISISTCFDYSIPIEVQRSAFDFDPPELSQRKADILQKLPEFVSHREAAKLYDRVYKTALKG